MIFTSGEMSLKTSSELFAHHLKMNLGGSGFVAKRMVFAMVTISTANKAT